MIASDDELADLPPVAQQIYRISEKVAEINSRGACFTELPGAVVVARDYLLLPSHVWRLQCGCEACMEKLVDEGVGDQGTLIVRVPASVGPEKDPAVTLELPNN